VLAHENFKEEIMTKFGRGLNREIVAEVNSGTIMEPFCITDVKNIIRRKAWAPAPTDKYVNSCLADGASEDHSPSYKKYFEYVGEGKYRVRGAYKGNKWQ